MKFLFVHTNFPAQFRWTALHLAALPAVEVKAIGSRTARPLPSVDVHRYTFRGGNVVATHPFARRFDLECRRAEQVLYIASAMAANGFQPDVIVAHSGWGEALPLRSVFPTARIISYCEYFYRSHSGDVNFDPEFPTLGIDGIAALHAKNANSLISLAESDLAISPTEWQKSTYPAEFADKIQVAHEGIDCDAVKPDANASVALPNGRVVTSADEVVTYVARNLEPIRGYHSFMRALPRLMAERPEAQILIVGGFEVSYGARPPQDQTWQKIYLDEVRDRIDLSRVHFLGPLPYAEYLAVLQVSSVHCYLTYPFVLSWSCLEAMAAGCVVVGSDTAPVREVIDDGVNGILVPFLAPDRIADAMIGVLADRDAHAPMREAARRTVVERFDLRAVCLPRLLELVGAPRVSGAGPIVASPVPSALPPA